MLLLGLCPQTVFTRSTGFGVLPEFPRSPATAALNLQGDPRWFALGLSGDLQHTDANESGRGVNPERARGLEKSPEFSGASPLKRRCLRQTMTVCSGLVGFWFEYRDRRFQIVRFR
jgi:hypothetical protein